MAKKRIFVTKEGNVITLCDNKIDNNPDLGDKTIKRAADVEFNNARQVWEIIAPDGTILGEHPRRDEAIKMEIDIVSERIRQSLLEPANT